MDEGVLTALIGVLSGGGILTLVQFFITRHDNKKGKFKHIEDQMSTIIGRLDSIEASMAEREATNARIRILSFAEEVRHKLKHSKESFDQINQDIDYYTSYCDEHPKYHNSRATSAIAHIKDVYDECLRENSFLS